MFAFALLAAAQAAAPAPAAAPTQGVISYPPEFFAAAQAVNAHEMITRLPGFTLETGDSVRGFEGAAGNVLIDGERPTTKSETLDELLRRIPARQVVRIDLIRGGAPGIDMQGKAVLANIVRRGGGGVQGVVAVAGTAYDDGRRLPNTRIELTGGGNGRRWEASYRYGVEYNEFWGEGPHLRLRPDGSPIRTSFAETHGERYQHTLTGAYEQPFLGGRLRINGRLFDEKSKDEEDNRVSFPAPALIAIDDRGKRRDTEIGGRFNRVMSQSTNLELIGLRQTRDQNSGSNSRAERATFFGLDRELSETIGRFVLRHRRSDALSFEMGGEGALNKLESRTSLAENGIPTPIPAADVGVEEKRGEVFLRTVWKPAPRLTIEAGSRYEMSTITSSGDVALEKELRFLKPRATAAYALTPTTQLRARVERVVGQLNFDDFVAESSLATGVVTAGNPDLNPEQAWVGEVGLEQRFWGSGVVVMTLRHSELTDAIDRAPVYTPTGQVYDAPANIGDGTRREFIVDLTVPTTGFGVPGGLLKVLASWRRMSVTDPTTRTSRNISGVKPLEWEASYTQDVPAWNSTFGVTVQGDYGRAFYRFSEVDERKVEVGITPFVEHRLRPDLQVRMELVNITGRDYRRTRTVYAGPRNVAAIQMIDDRNLQLARGVFARLRKTF